MNHLDLSPDQLEVLDGLRRSMLLNFGWTVHVLVAEDPRSLRPALLHIMDACLGGEGELYEVRHFDDRHDHEAIAALETLMARDSKVRQLFFMDFAQLDGADDHRACDFFTKLNSRRDRMQTHLRGELVVAIPSRVEARMLSAGPDLASGIRSRMLRRRPFDVAVLERWQARADERFESLLTRTPDAVARYQYGTYTFAYCFEPGAVTVPMDKLREHLTAVPGYSGWRPWWVPTTDFVPQIHDDVLECWMFGPAQLFADPAHSDFWLASARGELYLRRGYQEDSRDTLEPGRMFSNSLAIWRAGEALLHVDGFARQLELPRYLRVALRARWTGLAGRTLTTWPEAYARPLEFVSHDAEVSEQVVFTLADLPGDVAALVERLVRPLFERFEGYQGEPGLVAEHVRRMVERR